MHTPDKPEGEVSFVAIKETVEPLGENTYKMAFNGVETQDVTALTVRKDLTLWDSIHRWNHFYDRRCPRLLLESPAYLDQEER